MLGIFSKNLKNLNNLDLKNIDNPSNFLKLYQSHLTQNNQTVYLEYLQKKSKNSKIWIGLFGDVLNISNTLNILENIYLTEGLEGLKRIELVGFLCIVDARFEKTKVHFILSRTSPHHLYFYIDNLNSNFYFANTIPDLRFILPFKLKPNLKHVSQLLLLTDFDSNQTFYHNIELLEPGSILTVSHSHSHSNSSKPFIFKKTAFRPLKFRFRPKFYLFSLSSKKRQAIYHQFKIQYQKSISNCIQPNLNCAADLSGGLDSSSVALLAADILKAKNLTCLGMVPNDAQKLKKHIPQRSKWEIDDYDKMKDCVDFRDNIIFKKITESDFDLNLKKLAQFCVKYTDGPVRNPLNMGWISGRYQYCKKNKLNLLLTGAMGNFTVSWSGDKSFIKNFIKRCIKDGVKITLSLIPKSIQKIELSSKLFNKLLNKIENYQSASIKNISEFSLIQPNIISKYKLKLPRYLRRFYNHSQKHTLQNLPKQISHLNSFSDILSIQNDIKVRDPTFSEGIQGFLLSLPNSIFSNPKTQNKRCLIREGLGSELPKSVINNKTRGEQHPGWFIELKDSIPYFSEQLLLWKKNQIVSSLIDLSHLEKMLNTVNNLNLEDLKNNYTPREFLFNFRLKLGRALHIADWLYQSLS